MKTKREPKEVLKINDAIKEWTELRYKARQIVQLRKHKHSNDGYFMVMTESGEELVGVDVTKKEYEAIRRYLLRNRVREIRELGVEL